MKKRIPAVLFNDSDYKYPNGLRVNDIDQLNDMLKNGWNTGVVDKNRGKKVEEVKEQPKTTTQKRHLSQMNISELMEVAKNIGVKVDENWTKTQLYVAIKKRGR